LETDETMSFLSALFGRRAAAENAKAAEPVEYKGFIIRAAPFKNEGHYQTAGVIEREIGGVRKEHRFIRADAYARYDDAVSFTLTKARQIIDLQGERIFQ
jgi:hypothetical protein